MHNLINPLIQFLETMMQSSGIFGYFWLFMGTFSESFFVPIPSEILMGLAGYLIAKGLWTWPLVIFFAVLGNVISTAIVWKLGHTYGESFILKWGGYVGYDEEELDQAKRLFDRWGYGIIFVCQFVPVMRSVVTVPAGVLKTELVPTLIATGTGAAVWLAGWTYVGTIFGSNYKAITENEWVVRFEKPLYLIIGLAFVYYIYHHFYNAHKKKQKKTKVLES
jgi:membrane protein DedA with SNARE-associated domain